MRAYSLTIIISCICRYSSIEIKPELKKNIFNFGHGINFKYKGMLVHSFDTFYVATEFILPTISDLNFSMINFDETYDYLQEKNGCSNEAKEYIFDLRVYCKKIVTFIHYYKEQISSFNHKAHNILTNEISLILPKFPKIRKEKICIITSLTSGFIGLTYEGISIFLQNRRHKALHKAMKVMKNKVNVQCNKPIHLENSMVMYGVYNEETLEKLINTMPQMHNISNPNERLFPGTLSTALTRYVNKNGVHHYAINSLLYLMTLREKYIKM